MTVSLYLVASWLLCAGAGFGLAPVVLPRSWARERAWLFPILGAGALILLSATASYAGVGMHRAAPLVAGVAMAASCSGWFVARRRPAPVRSWTAPLVVHVLALAAASGLLWSVILYRAWNPYTDAFTYMSIADHLQTHGYFEPVVRQAQQPLLTQMWLYQHFGFRMGSNFLLAFFAALFRADYSFDVYPPGTRAWRVSGRAGILGAVPPRLAHGRCRLGDRDDDLCARHGRAGRQRALGVHAAGRGAVFLMPMLALSVRATGGRDWRRRSVAAGLCSGLLVLTYTEMVPFAALMVAVTFLVRAVFGRLRLSRALAAGALVGGIAIVAAPVAAIKSIEVLKVQSQAGVGWDPHLGLFDYFGLLTGYRSLLEPAIDQPGRVESLLRVLVVAGILTAAFAAVRAAGRVRRQAAALSAPFVAGGLWFGLCTVNRWDPAQVGQPWSTYKLATYGFFLFVALWGAGLARLWQSGGARRLMAAGQLAALAAFFVPASLQDARAEAHGMQELTGVTTDPIGEYKRLPGVLADLPPDAPVNLNLPYSAHKHRQLVAYFLRRPVLADWSEDLFVGPHLAGGGAPPDPNAPTLVWAPADPQRTVANLRLRRDVVLVSADFGAGWHEQEHDASHFWRWLEQEGQVAVTIARPGWLTARGDLAVVGAAQRTITIAVGGHPDQTVRATIGARGFEPFTSAPLHLPAGRYTLIVSADGPPFVFGSGDTRTVRIGVRDWTWSLTPE